MKPQVRAHFRDIAVRWVLTNRPGVTLVAEPGSAHSFVGWSKSCVVQDPTTPTRCVVPLAGNQRVVATFRRVEF